MDNHNWRRVVGREASILYHQAVMILPEDYAYLSGKGAELLGLITQHHRKRLRKWRVDYYTAQILLVWFMIGSYLDFSGNWTKDVFAVMGAIANLFFLGLAAFWFKILQKAKP